VTLVHAPLNQMPLHLIFNMYFLWLAARRERLYARRSSRTTQSPPRPAVVVRAHGSPTRRTPWALAIFGLFVSLVAAEQPTGRS
jgi:membrane associated rhomboid family serine protease